MDCAEVLSRLWEYLDGELSPEEAGALCAHLDRCGRCRPACNCERAFLALIARALRTTPSPHPTLYLSVRARLRAQG